MRRSRVGNSLPVEGKGMLARASAKFLTPSRTVAFRRICGGQVHTALLRSTVLCHILCLDGKCMLAYASMRQIVLGNNIPVEGKLMLAVAAMR